MTELVLCTNECTNCDGGCGNNVVCRYDEMAEVVLTKDTSTSRRRHHSKQKELRKQKQATLILESKAKRKRNNREESNKAYKRLNAYKKNTVIRAKKES